MQPGYGKQPCKSRKVYLCLCERLSYISMYLRLFASLPEIFSASLLLSLFTRPSLFPRPFASLRLCERLFSAALPLCLFARVSVFPRPFASSRLCERLSPRLCFLAFLRDPRSFRVPLRLRGFARDFFRVFAPFPFCESLYFFAHLCVFASLRENYLMAGILSREG